MSDSVTFRLSEYNALLADHGSARVFRGGVITIPGFNTTGWWQKDLVPILQRANLFNTPVDYGYVRAGIVIPKMQDRVVEQIMAAYDEQQREKNCDHPCVIAHSFGSLSLGWALMTRTSLRLSRVIVNGCILPCDFPWKDLADRGQVYRVLNEGGGKDPWPKVARWFVPRAGDSGCRGFTDFDSDDGVVVNRINPYGRHSDMHNKANFRQNWIAFLVEGVVPPRV